MNDTYRCSDCGQTKDLATGFYNNRSMKQGKETICKVCRKARQLEYNAKNPDYHKNYYYNVVKPARQAAAARRKDKS